MHGTGAHQHFGGVLYLDEYIGPSRSDWNDALIAPLRSFFKEIPDEARRVPELPLREVHTHGLRAGRTELDGPLRAAATQLQQPFAAHVAEYTQVNDTGGAPGPSDGQVAKTALAAIVAGADPTSFGGYDLCGQIEPEPVR